MQRTLAQLDGLIDLLVDELVREITSPKENAPATQLSGQATEARNQRSEDKAETQPPQA